MCADQHIILLNVEQIEIVFTGRIPPSCEATYVKRIVNTPKPTAGTYHSSGCSGNDSSSIGNLTMIDLAYVYIFVNVFLLDGLHLGRQIFRDSSTNEA